MKKLFLTLLFLTCFFSANQAQESISRQNVVANDNNITVEIWNYGSYSAPANRITNFVWNGLGYAYEIGTFIGCEVEVPEVSHPDVIYLGDSAWVAHVISDGLKSYGAEISSDGTMRWGFQPIIESDYQSLVYMDPASNYIPASNDKDIDLDGKPDNWPLQWWSNDSSKYQWPAHWQDGKTIGCSEFLYGMDDRDNMEFEYYPFHDDSLRQGLGVEISSRIFQIQDFYEDILFVSYELANVSDKDLNKMVFGIWGDPHIGGADDYQDDWNKYDLDHNMIYAYDADGYSHNNPEITPGYFGIVFLQTPGADNDVIDNDEDGMTDESQTNGIDDDYDWQTGYDDLGADGIANTSDTGEGDGIPTLGEPNFEYKDSDEADQIGLTSFASPTFQEICISDDERVWTEIAQPGIFDTTTIQGDYILAGSSGYFSLPKQQSVRVGLAFILGQDWEDLIANAEIAQKYYDLRIGSQAHELPLSVTSPQSNTRYETNLTIEWNAGSLPSQTELEAAYSIDNGKHWLPVISGITNTGSYELGVSSLPNSVFYKFLIRALSENGYGEIITPGFFTIDHSGTENVAPEVIFELANNTQISGNFELSWYAGDADEDNIELKLIIESTYLNDTLSISGTSYELQTTNYPNGGYILTIQVSDGIETASESHTVFIQNNYELIADSLVTHTSGIATGNLFSHIYNSSEISGHVYEITLKDSSTKTYSVKDLNIDTYVLLNETLPIYPEHGSRFDGLELSFIDDPFEINNDKTGWIQGDAQLEFNLFKNEKYYPADFIIEFYDDIADTSINDIFTPFKILDISHDSLKMKSYIFENNPANDTCDLGEKILIVSPPFLSEDVVYDICFVDPGYGSLPGSGNVFLIETFKPFTDEDRFIINTESITSISEDKTMLPQQFVLYQNYPNPFNPATTVSFDLPQSDVIELIIFDVLGRKVKSLINEKKFKAGHYKFNWNGLNESGSPVTTGIYFYRLRSLGKKNWNVTRKMLLIK